MQQMFVDALAPVLRDARSTGVPDIEIEDSDWAKAPGYLAAMLWDRPRGRGISVQLALPTAERIVSVADQVQEFVIESGWGWSRSNWPSCPHHPTTHPLAAELRHDTAVWICPVDKTVIAEIGAIAIT